MGISKAQKERVKVICKCGCGIEFSAFPTYRKKSEGGGLRVAEYKNGHHPNCRKNQTGNKDPWNKGLKKGDHPSMEKMGFQPGHEAFYDWKKVHEILANDPVIREKWLASKREQIPWNKGLTKDKYPNGIATGEDHGNWKGGHRGIVDTALWQELRLATLKRDNYTCQECGDRNRKGRGSRINLEVHHKIAICEDVTKALDPDNVVTLCRPCHYKTHNYGSKALVNRSGN